MSHGSFFGHPRGLATLFFTEVWERFSYYGMRPLLILYMTAAVTADGLGWETQRSSAIVGLYTFGVYALALPGGWIADRLLGQKKAVLIGGIVIAAGHYTLAVPAIWSFFTGLALVVLGTGLLKPNVSAIVGDLYTEDTPERRDAGFSIFYMGINIGAFGGPLVCGWLFTFNPHWGFGAAGVGMTLGLIQYVLGAKYLAGAGELKEDAATSEVRAVAVRRFAMGFAAVVVVVLALWWLGSSGVVPVTLLGFAQSTGVIVTILAVLYFAAVIVFVCRDAVERKRVAVIAALFLGAALFWSGFEQASTSLNLFAQDQTDRVIFGWEMPTSWLQAINPLFIILLAPVMGMLWVYLGARSPSLGMKFGYGLVLLGVGFLVLAWGASRAEAGAVSPMWLVTTYFFHTVGELCLSPVGLSSVTKLSPHRLVGQMMGTWFMGAALGNLIAGLVGGYIEQLPQDQLFATVAGFVIVAGCVFMLFAVPMRRLASGIR